jgi:hypothetical protein
MPNHRTLMRRGALVLAVVASASVPPAWSADDQDPPLARVRSGSPSIAAVIHQASERSILFRGLVARIDATDGLVYVDEGKCGHGVRACLTLSVQVAGPHRLLRILVESIRGQNTCDLMASIGHELWHAIELLGQPKVTNYSSAYSFFQREGPNGGGHVPFETAAAVRTGFEVGREVCVTAGREGT